MQSIQSVTTVNNDLFTVRKMPSVRFILGFFLSGIFTGFLLHFAPFSINLPMPTIQLSVSLLLAAFVFGIFFINSILLGQYGLRKIANANKRTIRHEVSNSFTAIIPAMTDTKKLTKTIQETAKIEYPRTKKQIIIVTRFDDFLMNRTAEIVRQSLPDENILIYSYYDAPKSRTHALNCGLELAEKNIIVVFDEGDVPHPALYKMANTYFSTQDIDVLQSDYFHNAFYTGKQKFFASFDRFLWLVSVLPAAFTTNLLLFGENITLFRKSLLLSLPGWDESVAHADRELLYRMQTQNTKAAIISDRYLRKFTAHTYSLRDLLTRWYDRAQIVFSIITKEKWLFLEGFGRQIAFLYTAILPLLPFFILSFLAILFIVNNIILWSIAGSILFLFYVQLVVSLYIQTNKYTLKNMVYSIVYALLLLVSFVPLSFVLTYIATKVLLKNLMINPTLSVQTGRVRYA